MEKEMSGYTKHVFENDINGIKNDLRKYINNLILVLPFNYEFETIKCLLEKYYPYEWFIINEKYKYYCIKEACLKKKGKKSRFKMDEPDKIIQNLSIYKKIMSPEYIRNHQKSYSKEAIQKNQLKLSNERNSKIKKKYDKIQKALMKTQQVEPEFLDVLIGLYDRKNTSQKDKVYIMHELQKYYCTKVIRFFSKKVDTEYNPQLRRMAFIHLQSLGFQPVLRKQKYMIIPSKNKKRREYLKEVYAKERYKIEAIPEELEYRIENSKEQLIKSFDFFISHSSSDYETVQKLIYYLNSNGKNVYCDWINDNDYLKRKLVGEATLCVIKKRLQQSKAIIFVNSERSLKSNWCKYELNYFDELAKPIYIINGDEILNEKFEYYLVTKPWFKDNTYKELALF